MGDAAGGGLDDGFQRVGGVAAPIAVKFLRNARYDAAAHQHIHIGKSGFLRAVGKVFIANIASADDAGAIVGGTGFVVHTAVYAGKIG